MNHVLAAEEGAHTRTHTFKHGLPSRNSTASMGSSWNSARLTCMRKHHTHMDTMAAEDSSLQAAAFSAPKASASTARKQSGGIKHGKHKYSHHTHRARPRSFKIHKGRQETLVCTQQQGLAELAGEQLGWQVQDLRVPQSGVSGCKA
mgnify:CR=1 FL=1